MTVVHVGGNGSPLVSLRLVFAAGAADEPRGQEGVAALSAALVAEGGTGELTAAAVMDQLYPMAARIEAHVDREVTVFVGECHRDHLGAFLDLFLSLIAAPRFDAADFERLRDQQLAYLTSTLRGNDDEELGKEALASLIFAGHPYGRPVAGAARALRQLQVADAKAWHATRMALSALTIGIAGDVPETVAGDIASRLQALAATAPPRQALPSPRTLVGLEALVVEKDCMATAISIGFPLAPTRADDDFYPLLVANSYLGEHRTFHGVLMRELRESRGLNYGDYSYLEHFVQDGDTTFPLPHLPRRQQAFTVWIRPVAHQNRLFALRAALAHVARVAGNGLTAEQFEQAREFLANYSLLWTQTRSRALGYLLDSHWYGIGEFAAEIRSRLAGLSLDEVNAAAHRHLRPDGIAVAMVTADAERAAAEIAEGAPSPALYGSAGMPAEVLAADRELERFALPAPRTVRVAAVRDLFEEAW